MAGRNGRSRARAGPAGRRVLFLAVAGLLTLSLTFLLGVLVGRQWGGSPPPKVVSEPAKKSPAGARRALSEIQVDRPPQIQEKLTFYQTLTAPLGATPPPPKPEPRPREEPAKDRPKTEADLSALTPERAYTVQVGAYRARAAAEEMERKLRGAGFEAYVATVSGDDGRPTYRVRVGSFATRPEAEQMAERLRSDRRLSSFVTAR